MEQSLELIDRFFNIIINSQSKNSQRLQSQWTYLLALLKSNPVSYQRIDAYLNILNQQSSIKRNTSKTRKSQGFEHPEINKFTKNIEALSKIIDQNTDKIALLEKIATL